MAPTNKQNDTSQRCDLGAHQNFMETSRALIKHTNVRIDKMNAMSDELRRLANQIESSNVDKSKLQLTPQVKSIKETPEVVQSNKRQSIDIVIPDDRDTPYELRESLMKPIKEDKIMVKTKTPKGKTKHRHESKGKKGETQKNKKGHDVNLDAKSPESSANQKSNETQLLYDIYKRQTSKKKKIFPLEASDTEENNSTDSKSPSSRHCWLFHKFGFVEPGSIHITEKFRVLKPDMSNRHLRTNVVNLSLPSPIRSEQSTNSSTSRRFEPTTPDQIHLWQKPSTACAKNEKFKRFELNRRILLPKKINLEPIHLYDMKDMASLSIDHLPTGFRLRVGNYVNSPSRHTSNISDMDPFREQRSTNTAMLLTSAS